MDPDLRNFAVFINSSSSTYKSTTKSVVQIPFNGNLSSHDPSKLLRVALSQMKFTNSVYNITEENNTLQICAEFSAGRGYAETDYRRLWQTWTMRIPVGYYNTTGMATILSEKGTLYPEKNTGLAEYANRVGYESIQQKFSYAAQPATLYGPARAAQDNFNNVFVGFGANPADPTDPINTPGAISIEINSKVALQSPDLSHLVQLGTDIITPCQNILAANEVPDSGSLDFSMVYRGIHLLFNSTTEPLLTTLGFYNPNALKLRTIPGYHDNEGVYEPTVQGYSLYLSPRLLKIQFPNPANPTLVFDPDTMAYAADNAVYYVFTTESDPNAVLPISFVQPPNSILAAIYGLTTGAQSPLLTMRDFLVPDGAGEAYYAPIQGDFVSGVGISQPSPYFVSEAITSFPAIIASGTNDTIAVLLDDWNTNSGYGLTTGRSVRPSTYNLAGNGTNCIGRYIKNIDLTGPTYVVLTLDDDVTRSGGTANQTWESVLYTLSTGQTVLSEGASTIYQLMIVSAYQIPTAAAVLRPALLSNLEGLDEIHVHCPQLRTQHYSSTAGEALAPSDVIAVIPVDATFGSKQTFQPPVTLESFLNNTNISTLEFRLTDSQDNLLNFNGVDWSLVLKCDEVDVTKDPTLATSGFLNTPFQDQLNVLEGTALQQMKAQKRRLPYEFYENNKNHKSNDYNRYFNK